MKRSVAYYFLIIATLFWGSGYVAAAIPIREVSPLVAVLIRHVIMGIGSFVILMFYRSQWKKLQVKDHLILLTIGIFLSIYNWFYLEGLKRTAVMDGIFIESCFVPIFTILILYLLNTSINREQWIGVCIAIVGSGCFFYPIIQLDSFGTTRILGILILLLSVFSWIAYTLIGKSVFTKIDPIFATAYAMLFSFIFLTVVSYPVIPSIQLSALSNHFWIAQLFLGLFASVIGNILYSIGLKQVGPAVSSMFLFFVPVIGFLLAHLFVQETLSLIQFIGIMIMLAGIWFANRVGKNGSYRKSEQERRKSGKVF